MPVSQFELMHGAVLAKIVRNDKKIALTLIEKEDVSRSVYLVNDQIILYIKHSLKPKEEPKSGGKRWQFTFSEDHLEVLAKEKRHIFLALVCGSEEVREDMEIALIEHEKISELLDLSTVSGNQVIYITSQAGKSLRAEGSKIRKEITIPRNKIDEWDVPGR